MLEPAPALVCIRQRLVNVNPSPITPQNDGPRRQEIGHDPFGDDVIEAVNRIGRDDGQV